MGAFTNAFSIGCNTLGTLLNQPPDGNPSMLILNVLSETSIKIDWTIGSTNHDGHSIEMSIDEVNYTEIATVTGSTATYTKNGLTAETLYYFRVRAYKSTVYSDYSSVVSETTYYWFNSAGITTAVAAYQAVGVADAAASYVNKKNPGTYNLTPTATPPTWNTTTGWKFLITRYLDTGLILQNTQNLTVIVSVNNPMTGYQGFWGGKNGSDNASFYLWRDDGTLADALIVNANRAQYKSAISEHANQNIVVAATNMDIFINGIVKTIKQGAFNITPTESCFIGATRNGATYEFNNTGYIHSFIVINEKLSYSKIAAISKRMSQLTNTETEYRGISVLENITYSTTNPID